MVNSDSEELEEYKKLIEGILTEVKKDDFKNAVDNAKKNYEKLDDLEKRYKDFM